MRVTVDDILADRIDTQLLRDRGLQLQVPPGFNFAFDILDRRAEDPSATAVVAVAKDRRTVRHISYAALSRDSGRLASALTARGFGPGDRALVMMARVPEWFTTIFGCIKAAVSPAPATNLLSSAEIRYRIAAAGMRIAFVTPENLERVRAASEDLASLELIVVIGEADRKDDERSFDDLLGEGREEVSRRELPANACTDEMILFFTSGTSAHPKMVSHDHRYALAHYVTGTFWMDLRPGDLHWTLTDTGWAKAAWGLLFPPLIKGASVLLYDSGTQFDAQAHLELLERMAVTCFCAPPTVYRQFVQLDLARYDLRALRHSLAAGEPLNPEVIRSWQDASGTAPRDGYGQTETICIVANQPGMPIKPGSMGRPLPGNVVAIVDEAGEEVADEGIGDIAVKIDGGGTGIFSGYGGASPGDRSSFRHGWYFTGDTGRRDADGYFWFVGRRDDVITSAGYRISPFEVESALLVHPAVAESAVIGIPDPLRGHVVKAFIVLATGWQPTDDLANTLKDHVKHQHAFYSYPRHVEFVDALPKTVSGKIRRAELRSQNDEAPELTAGHAPRSDNDQTTAGE